MRSADGRQSLGRKWKLDLGGGGHRGPGSAVQLAFLSAPLGTGTSWAVLSSWPLSWAPRQGRGGYRLCEWAFGEGGGWPMAASLAGLRDKTPESHREELPDGVIRENRLCLGVRKSFQVLPVGNTAGKLKDTVLYLKRRVLHGTKEELPESQKIQTLCVVPPQPEQWRRSQEGILGHPPPPPPHQLPGHFHLQETLRPRPLCLLTTSPSSVSCSWA